MVWLGLLKMTKQLRKFIASSNVKVKNLLLFV
ncbi:UNVERIFIED_CONTAM: hypothetical protein GTU68_031562 [Idotea baltica]|nr:hypothetical protein [Idotea baltica]